MENSKPYSMQDWRGGLRSLEHEYDYWIDEIEGEIPPDLNGTLFRNGPGLFKIGDQRIHHPFDGDGMICAITFSDGRAHFRNRFVRTEGYTKEKEAQQILYRGVFGTQKPGGWLANAFNLNFKNVANTHIIYWSNKLLALWEAALPHRLNPEDLTTFGIDTMDGVLKTQFAAHPKVDPGSTGQEPLLVGFAIKAGPQTTISIYEFDQAGRKVRTQEHKVPGFAFIHDFAITPNYCLFLQNPVSFNLLPLLLGFRGAAECMKFNSDRPTKIWAIPREPGMAVRVFDAPSCFSFHHANAFEQGGEIIIDSICSESLPASDYKEDYENIDFDRRKPWNLYRFNINLKTTKVTQKIVVGRSCEFPAIHPNFVGKKYRWLFLAAAHESTGDAPQQAIIKVDVESGEEQFWSVAPKGFVGEPVFVPKPNASQEDDGWLLVLIYNAKQKCSELAILEGSDLSKGAIARLHLKHNIPYGLHGSFVHKTWLNKIAYSPEPK